MVCTFVILNLKIMMKRFFVSTLFIAILFSLMSSCKKGERVSLNDEKKNRIDTLWNDKVQDTFYDISFGANKSEVIEHIMKYDFSIRDFSNNDIEFKFYPLYGDSFTFGGIEWMQLCADFNGNDEFWLIQFRNAFKDKTIALENYNHIKSRIEKKYLLTEVERKDSTLYAAAAAFCRSGSSAMILCQRFESVNHNIMYEVSLSYFDKARMSVKVSDDL